MKKIIKFTSVLLIALLTLVGFKISGKPADKDQIIY